MPATAQLQLSQHGVYAEDSHPFQCVHVHDPVLPPRLQHPSETAEVEMVEPSRLLLVHHPGVCFIQLCQEVDGLVHLRFCAELKTVTVPNCVLKTTEGSTDLGNPEDHFIVDFGAAGEGAVQIREVVHLMQLGSALAD
ncbi:hypothetical protein SprV_0501889900 [Sparganum proliferum]